jgi:translation machinery-associated protein 16
MASSDSAKKAATKPKQKREKIFHPESRKAGQLARTQLRKSKLMKAASKRHKKFSSQIDVFSFFYHAIPPDSGVLSLEELHDIVQNIWLTRHDIDLEAEQTARRKGRPKSAKELKLEEIKLREVEEYRTGMEVIDLTHAPTVELFRKWNQKEFAYIQMLRFIRISSSDPTTSSVSKPGKHHTLCNVDHCESSGDHEMDTVVETSVQQEFLGEPVTRFSSTMMTMDGLP